MNWNLENSHKGRRVQVNKYWLKRTKEAITCNKTNLFSSWKIQWYSSNTESTKDHKVLSNKLKECCTHHCMWCTIITILAGGGFLSGRRWTVTPALWMLGTCSILPYTTGRRLPVAHHHLLVLLLLLLLNHQQLVVVLLLLLAWAHRVIRLGSETSTKHRFRRPKSSEDTEYVFGLF